MNIGVFDSGRGGKLIADKIKLALPQVNIIFKSDPKYFPYGNKSTVVIFDRLVHFTKTFIRASCSIIVIACNSATTNAINQLRNRFPHLIFVGIEPPVKAIIPLTRTGRAAIIGTQATISSHRHQELVNQHGRNIVIYNIACPGLAEAIETNPNPRSETRTLLRRFLDQPLAAGVDVVGLACTHYPYLLDQIQALYPRAVFYDPADAVVRQVVKLTHEAMGTI